jgi:tricorn protease-like protein
MKKIIWNTNIQELICNNCKSRDISQLCLNNCYINAEIYGDEIYINKLNPICNKCKIMKYDENIMKFIL